MATDKKKTSKPKAPQDRKPKKQKGDRPEDVLGFKLLRPMSEVPVWDQTDLLGLVYQLQGNAGPDGRMDIDEGEVIPLLGKIAKSMVPLAYDEKEFTKFCTGEDALQRVMDLSMAWVAAQGEGKSSADN